MIVQVRACLWFCVAALILGTSTLIWAQGPTPAANADIVKMIQAGLPETAVVNKIREGAGRWDTSIDALIALKQYGATALELQVLSEPAAVSQPTPLPVADNGTPVLGGILRNRNGDVTFDIRGDPNGYASLHFHLVLVPTGPALMALIRSQTNGTILFGPCIDGDLLITATETTFYPYQISKCGADRNPFAHKSLAPNLAPISNPLSQVHFPKLGKNGPGFEWGEDFFHKDRPTPSRAFLDLLFKDFPGTMAILEQAAGLSDPATQLSVASHYHPLSKEEAVAWVERNNQDEKTRSKMDEINAAQRIVQEQQEAKLHPPPPDSGNGLLSVLNVVQGVTNMQQAMQDAKVADLSHNAAGQLRAATNATTAEMQTLGAVSGSTATIQPLAPSPGAPLQTPAKSTVTTRAQNTQTGYTYQISQGQPGKTVALPATQPGTNIADRSTGTAPPPTCVYLSPSQPCVPLAQYQQMQAQQSTRVPVETCPPSGFVPGLMRRTSSDTSEGVPCSPGQPIDPSLFAANGPTGSSSASPGASSPGTGGSGIGGPFDPDLDNCVVYFYKNDPITGDHLFLQNNCSIRAQVYFYASPQVHGGVAIDPGEVDNTYAAHDQIIAAGNLSIYACPVNDTPRQTNGSLAYNGINNRFLCSRN